MEYLNCEGCEKLSDNAFRYILMAFSMVDSNNSTKEASDVNCFRKVARSKNKSKKSTKSSVESVKIIEDCNECINQNRLNNIEDIVLANEATENSTHRCNCNEGTNSLRSINLSGCWSITDYGLR